jgi:hypothetical protein
VTVKGQYVESYLATARHNIDCSSKDKPLYARVNMSDNTYKDILISFEDFECHPTSDVAILPIKLPIGIYATSVQLETILTKDMLEKFPLKEGAELCMPALFSEFTGSSTMYPVFRRGHLALVPKEKVMVQLTPRHRQPLDAYLIECLSWGGCSGAPVFMDHATGEARLMGILCSHFSMPTNKVDQVNYRSKKSRHQKRSINRLSQASEAQTIRHNLNAGIAVVVPAQGIMDLLMLEHLVEQRERNRVEYLSRSTNQAHTN